MIEIHSLATLSDERCQGKRYFINHGNKTRHSIFLCLNTNYLTRHSIFGHEYEISNLVQAFVHM